MSVGVDERKRKPIARRVMKSSVIREPSFTISFGRPEVSDIVCDNDDTNGQDVEEDETSCFLRMDERRFNYEMESPFAPINS